MSKKLEADVLFLNSEYEAAADKYLDGAREGDRLSAFNYGYCLWKGLGRAYNPKEAKSYFAFARDLDGGEACYNLAMMYMHGEGVSRDYKKALHDNIRRAGSHRSSTVSRNGIYSRMYV